MDNICVVKEATLTIEKKPLLLVLPYLGSISLPTKTKLTKSLRTFLIVINFKWFLKIRPDQETTFSSMIAFPKIFLLVPFIYFSVDSAMAPIIVNM